jgi:hypothetical protein
MQAISEHPGRKGLSHELIKKIHRRLTFAPEDVQSVKTRSFAALLQLFLAVFHILFHGTVEKRKELVEANLRCES